MKRMMESAVCHLYAVSHAAAFPVPGDTQDTVLVLLKAKWQLPIKKKFTVLTKSIVL